MGDVTVEIAVDLAGHVPPFEQVRAQIADLIAAGRLLPGDQLPTVRALAADLGLASNTVARAYKALEAGGLVEAHSRAGTRVANGQHTAEVALVALAAKFAAAAHGAGLSEARAVEVVRTALRSQAHQSD
ncbi:MAG TPA: GntR family transcriptional regulator [Humibacillus sp.]|nr:GntR family transcriptional regulator [Humibacillus sp.]